MGKRKLSDAAIIEVYKLSGTASQRNRGSLQNFKSFVSSIDCGSCRKDLTGFIARPPPPPPPASNKIPIQVVQAQQISEEEKASAALRETFDRELYDYIAGCVQGESGIADCLLQFSIDRSMEPEMLSELSGAIQLCWPSSRPNAWIGTFYPSGAWSPYKDRYVPAGTYLGMVCVTQLCLL